MRLPWAKTFLLLALLLPALPGAVQGMALTPPAAGQVILPLAAAPDALHPPGRLEGTVATRGYCDANPGLLEGVPVVLTFPGGKSETIVTDPAGHYEWWSDQASVSVQITVRVPVHELGQATVVVVIGQVTVQDFNLRWLMPCAHAAPGALARGLPLGTKASDELTLTNSGALATDYELLVKPRPTGEGSLAWLTVTPGNGTLAAGASEIVIVTFDAAQVPGTGAYSAQIDFTSKNPADPWHPTIAIPVDMAVGDVLQITPGSIELSLPQGETGTRPLTIRNSGSATLNFTIGPADPAANWASANPAGASLAPGAQTEVGLTVDTTTLSLGDHTLELLIASDSALAAGLRVPVAVHVTCALIKDLDFTFDPAAPKMGQTVHLAGSAAAFAPVAYAWSFGDGTPDGATAAVDHVFPLTARAAAYSVRLTAGNACSATAGVSKTVKVSPYLAFLPYGAN